ncbi:hypothetical protein ACFQV2_32380 [Actinokineospora soli]|uniref:Uncharacterized protein n=1 Tax=Actinokineospora soli TaxID=1048753 RepID=A0ABW2TUL9_9PSEU
MPAYPATSATDSSPSTADSRTRSPLVPDRWNVVGLRASTSAATASSRRAVAPSSSSSAQNAPARPCARGRSWARSSPDARKSTSARSISARLPRCAASVARTTCR